MKKLYEGNATGKIPDQHFTRLLAKLQKAGADLTPEEAQRLEAHQSRKKRKSCDNSRLDGECIVGAVFIVKIAAFTKSRAGGEIAKKQNAFASFL